MLNVGRLIRVDDTVHMTSAQVNGMIKNPARDNLRYRLLHLPAKLTTHARRRWLSIPDTWPWAQAFLLCWHRLTTLPTTT